MFKNSSKVALGFTVFTCPHGDAEYHHKLKKGKRKAAAS